MAFTAKDVQSLREKTGCGMMDCKKALVECEGDMDKAVDFLREKGLAAQAKKSGRIAAEGVVATYINGKVGSMVEVNAETDFVAGGDAFKELANKIAKIAAEQNPADLDALNACTDDGKTVEQLVQDLFLVVRENLKVRRFVRVEGNVVSYVHAGGRIGVLVDFDTTDEIAAKPEFVAMAKDVAMQIAAINPGYLNKEAVPQADLDHEKEIMVAQMKEDPKMANKPEQVLNKIVEGKMGKFFKENCLTEQEFVKDSSVTVSQFIANTAKALGGEITLKSFTRYEKGEGIQKREDDFAAEVANMVK